MMERIYEEHQFSDGKIEPCVPREEIVRCRDCKYMAGENDMGVSPNYCSKLSYYIKFNCYCAWGEKR